ncbi:class I SAM-dependent methyltransferase [Hwanghaeella sp.]|uniref:class I SAM-dependent methyltransferase n=1 Tax=Hwanghaeella sp. TaxID=2605943 RepID=UPI003CCC3243
MLRELAATLRRKPRDVGLGPAYAVSQAARTAWFAGQYLLAARLTPPPNGPLPTHRIPGWDVILKDLSALYRRDWENIRAGLYRPPADLAPRPSTVLKDTRDFLTDLPKVAQRRRRNANSEVLTGTRQKAYPRYYLQNFHYQTDGWFSEESAEAYDHQVEVLFTGGADAMRRQALPAIGTAVETHTGTSPVELVDIACGTGRFLKEVLRNNPTISATGLDLSRPYLKKAQRSLIQHPDVRFLEANAEDIPAKDGSYDIATCIYLFHELPKKVRRTVAAEIARIVRPGGLLVFIDSIQTGDHPPYDALLQRFPMAFHEPYYTNYLEDDLSAVFEDAGFEVASIDRAFFSRVMVLRRLA